jgi:Na+:H+ antiporter, NhaA family
MTERTLSREPVGVENRPLPSLASITRFVVDRFLLLPLGAVVALLWANTAAESYFTFSYRAAFVVNDIGMALFFGLITQEVIDAVMPGGALHSWRRWTTAFIAAAGGAIGAAVVYIAYVEWQYETILRSGWPVACAIDAAAAYYVLKLFYGRRAVLPFVLLVAIVTDLAAVVVVGIQHEPVHARAGSLLLGLALVVALVLRWQRVRSFWPYLTVAGSLSWIAFYLAGLHPALALVPVVAFLPHEPRRLALFADITDDDEVHHYEHRWNTAVQAVLFFFGLVNAGVLLHQYDTGSWAIFVASLVGRPLGMLAAVAFALLLGLHLPKRMQWRELIVAALATSSGFTFALFFSTSLFPIGPVLNQIKLGALLTALGAVLAIGAAWLLRQSNTARYVR